MNEEQIGHKLIGAALKVHSALGPGSLENACETCLVYELEKLDLAARRQVPIPIRYEALSVDNGYRIDLLIDRQLPSYLCLGGFKLGYLLSFNVAHCATGSSGS